MTGSVPPRANQPLRRFDGQTAIVTGAAKGIGLGIARRIAEEGAAVALLDVDESSVAASGNALAADGLQVEAVACDITQQPSVDETVARLRDAFGRIDVLVNAAGINGVTTALTHELAPSDFDRVLDVNLRGMFLCIRAVLPSMLAANYGRIVNISSISGKHGNTRMIAYTASKAAIIGITKVIGQEYAETGITCNAVAPALVRTTATEQAHSPERFRELTGLIPMQRSGEIEEVAAVAAFAASPECSFTTGFTFDCSGGRAVY